MHQIVKSQKQHVTNPTSVQVTSV